MIILNRLRRKGIKYSPTPTLCTSISLSLMLPKRQYRSRISLLITIYCRSFTSSRFRVSKACSFSLDTMFDYPRVLLDLLERNPFLWIEDKQLFNVRDFSWENMGVSYSLDQILCFWTYKIWDCHLPPRDPPLCHDRSIFKWRLANQKFVRQHAQTP